MRNLVTDVPGVLVGNAQDRRRNRRHRCDVRTKPRRGRDHFGRCAGFACRHPSTKALRPVHAPNDGDTVFAAATGAAGPGGDPPVLTELGTVAADCLARAVARGVYEATALPYENSLPDWKTRFGGVRA